MFKRIVTYFRSPRLWFAVLLYIITAGLVAFSIVLAVSGEGKEFPFDILSYLVYAVASVFLVYTVYTIIWFAPKIKAGVYRFLGRFKIVKELHEDFGFRTILFAVGSILFNLGYATFNLIMAGNQKSSWLYALSGYYFLLFILRGLVLLFHQKNIRTVDFSDEDSIKLRSAKAYGVIGVALIAMPIVLIGFIVRMIVSDSAYVYVGITIYVAAVYAFYKITMSIINVIKARKNEGYTVQALRNIGLADAMVSILALQIALIKAFSDGEGLGILNAVTGGLVCFFTATLGIYMVVTYKKQKRIIKNKSITDKTDN